MQRIAVVDYGMGNLRSVAKALEHVAPGAHVCVTAEAHEIESADRVVFPGQGAMRDCMRELDSRQLRAAIEKAAKDKPFLGICIGQQLLFTHSEEGDTPGLNILPGEVCRFAHDAVGADGLRLKVPHMGWSQVRPTHEHPLWANIPADSRFYYVHSYYVVPADPNLVAATTDYPFPFAGAVARDSLFAVQFHPEKSADVGLQLLKNFVTWSGA